LLTNLVAVPLCALILGFGYLSILVVDLPAIGPIACCGVRWSTSMLVKLADAAAAVEHGSYAVGRPPPALLVAYYVSALLWLAGRPVGSVRVRRTLGIAFGFCVVGIHAGPPVPRAPDSSAVAVIDVGQAQSIVARGRRGGTVLVDAGGSVSPRFDPGERIVLPFLLRWSGRRIDAMILSHDHLDHVGGAEALLRELEVGSLCLPPGFHRSPVMADLAARARQRSVSIRICEWGERFRLGGLSVRVVGPRRSATHRGSNDRSVSVLLGSAPTRLLIPGDLECLGEAALVSLPLPLRGEALVLSHHGSASGTSREFLERVRPRHAIVSCGKGNRFGHPSPQVCRRVRDARVMLWRTDRDGMLLLRARDGQWVVDATRPRR
jgi:competence protein ComEC